MSLQLECYLKNLWELLGDYDISILDIICRPWWSVFFLGGGGGGGKPANVCGGLGRSKGGDLGHMQQITRLGFKPECFHNMEFRHTHLGGITLLKPS